MRQIRRDVVGVHREQHKALADQVGEAYLVHDIRGAAGEFGDDHLCFLDASPDPVDEGLGAVDVVGAAGSHADVLDCRLQHLPVTLIPVDGSVRSLFHSERHQDEAVALLGPVVALEVH